MHAQYAVDLAHVKIENISIINIFGDMVSTNIESFGDICNIALKDDPEVIALNMKYVEHIDSISINHLFRLSKKLIEKNIVFIVYDITTRIKEVLETINFDTMVKIVSKEQFEKDYIHTI